MSLHDDKYRNGREVMDSTPMSLPVGFRRPPSLIEQMRSMIRHELSEGAARAGRETFEESLDFEIPDDPDDPTTPYEHAADNDPEVMQGLEHARLAREARRAGFKPPSEKPGWMIWAEQSGWTPPPSSKPSEPAAPAAAAPSAGANSATPAKG